MITNDTFSVKEFRDNTRAALNLAEAGTVIYIVRHGKVFKLELLDMGEDAAD